MRYLMFCESRGVGRVGQWVEVPEGASGDDYGRWQEEFASAHGAASRDGFYRFARMVRFSHWEVTESGIRYSEELAGPGGMSFELFQLPGDTDEAVEAAKEQIYRQRDVVRLWVVRIGRLLPDAVLMAAVA